MTTPLLVYSDTAPVISGILTDDATGLVLDLTGCSVYIQIRLTTDRRFRVNALCDIVSATDGSVSYQLATDDLDFVGESQVRYLVIYPDTRRQHTTPAAALIVEAE